MRRRAKATSAIALICGIVLCASASPALAAKGVVGFFGGTGTLGGQFSTASSGPGGVAVNLNGAGGASAGDVYLVDRGNNRVQQFSSEGAFVRAFGFEVNTSGSGNVCTVAANCKAGTASSAAGGMSTPQGIAIEQGTGNLYVTDQGNRRIDVFSATGSFQGAFGWGAATGAAAFELCTLACSPPAAAGANAGQFAATGIGYLAISPSNGDVLVADKGNRRVQEFKPTIVAGQIATVSVVRAYGFDVVSSGPDNTGTGYEVCNVEANPTDVCKIAAAAGTGVGQFATTSPGAIAIDSSGRVYALDTFNNRIQAFSPTAAAEGVFAAAKISGAPQTTDVAFDPASNHVLAIKPCNATICPEATLASERRVLELDTAGSFIEAHAAKAGIANAVGLGVGPTGKLYLATASAGPEARPGAFVLSSPLLPPGTTISPPSNVTGTTATFEGKVKTDSIPASYHFEYSPDGSSWTKVPASDVVLPGDGAEHVVSANASGLSAKTAYQVKLVATKSFAGGVASAETSFETSAAPPAIGEMFSSHVSDTTATLHGAVNPQNEASKYRFEYVTEEHFEAEGFFGAQSAPTPPGSLLAGSSEVAVETEITGLAPATTYRYRLTAFNEAGTSHGDPDRFTTYSAAQQFDPCPNDALRTGPSALLPDCRAYEQASPTDKNGGSIQARTVAARTAIDGSTIGFESSTGIPGGSGSQSFPTYIAKRGTGGWTTTGLLPDPSSGQRAMVLGWTPDFATVFDKAELLGGGAALLARSTADGAQTQVVPHTLPQPAYDYLGVSEDGSKVLFEAAPQNGTNIQLTLDAAADFPNVYAWDPGEPGELHLAGVLPDGSIPPLGSRASRDEDYNRDSRVVGTEGSVFFNDRRDGRLYLRLNPTAPETATKDVDGNCVPDPLLACTVPISASQKDDGKGIEGRDAAGTSPATFMVAAPDASLVTFTSSEKLTNDAHTGPEPEPATIAKAKAEDGSEKDFDFILRSAWEIAVDEVEEYVYWTDPAGGTIGRAALDGTEVDEEFIETGGEPLGIAVVDEGASKYVFWTDRGPLNEGEPQAGMGSVGRADLNGTNVDPGCYSGLTNPRSVAARPDFVYWTMPAIGKPNQGDLEKAALSCSSPSKELITQELPSNEIVHVANGDIAVNASHIYLSNHNGSFNRNVYLFELDGTFVTTIASLPSSTGRVGMALDSSHVYWTEPENERIGRANLDGSDPNESFIAAAGHAGDLAVGAGALLWGLNYEVPSNPGADLYQLDRASGELVDLAPDGTHANGAEVRGVLGASENGSFVYFAANGIPDGAGNIPNEEGETPVDPGDCQGVKDNATGTCNLYVAHDGQVDFIARLDAKPTGPKDNDSSDAVNWASGHLDVEKEESDKSARVSADGQVLVFRSRRQLIAYDNQGPRCIEGDAIGSQAPGACLEFYRFDYAEMSLACLTCSPRGATPEGPARLASLRPPSIGKADQPADTLARNLSATGERFFFETPDALVAADTNSQSGCPGWGTAEQQLSSRACQDVYEWEAPGAGSCSEASSAYSTLNQGCIYLLSTGQSTEASFFGDADPDGENAFIFTYERLVLQDEDALLDAYDVKAGGGLASQHAPPAPLCEVNAGACEGPSGFPSGAAGPATAAFSGPGDSDARATKPRRCPKGKRRVSRRGKVRCVKRARRSRATNHERRATR